MTTKLDQLMRFQSLPLNQKIALTEMRINSFYQKMNGKVYIAFSGGKDSTVLLHIARILFPEVKAIFSDTGLEFPEIRDFVKTFENVDWVKPKKSFSNVIEKYGYPVISKKVSGRIERIRKTKNPRALDLYLNGGETGRAFMLSKKWKYLLNAPFKISEKCCYYLKKSPLDRYAKKTGLRPIIGTMTEESAFRQKNYVSNGCNVFTRGKEKSMPLSFWTENDIWKYIKEKNLLYSKIYDMGEKRTGCMFCMFGIDKDRGRFERMKRTHPKQYKYCMENLGIRNVLEYIYPQGEGK